jgi:hypothetical protein
MTADQCQQLFFEHERLLKSSNDEATKKKLAETNNKLDQIHERLLEKVDKIGVPGVWRARFLRYLFFCMIFPQSHVHAPSRLPGRIHTHTRSQTRWKSAGWSSPDAELATTDGEIFYGWQQWLHPSHSPGNDANG